MSVSLKIFSPETGCVSYVETLYVEEPSRGRGIARDIVKRFLAQQKGSCGFSVSQANEPAIAFWERLLKAEGYSFTKTEGNGQSWCYRVERN